MEKKKEINEVAEFEVGQILSLAMTIGVTIVGIAYLLQVTGDVRDDMTANTAEYNATVSGITALKKFPDKMGMIVTIIIAAIIIGILVRYLWVGSSRGM